MTDEFTASNGIVIVPTKRYGLNVHCSGHVDVHALGTMEAEALREYFQYERDEVELPTEPGIYRGHDRLTENENFLVVVEDGVIYIADPSSHRGLGAVLGQPERFAPFVRLTPEDRP